jgi:hypothetical protein
VSSEVNSALGKILKSILSNGRSIDAPDYNQAKKEALKIYHVIILILNIFFNNSKLIVYGLLRRL